MRRDVATIHKLAANHGRKPDSIQITVLVDSDKGVPSDDDLKRYRDAGVGRFIPFSQKMVPILRPARRCNNCNALHLWSSALADSERRPMVH